MNLSLMAKTFIGVALISIAAIADNYGDPVVIDPSIQNFKGIFSQKLAKKYVIGVVTDKRLNIGSDTVGATRTGRFVTSPLVCKPLPSAVLLNSLAGMLRELGALAEDKGSADFQIDAELLSYTIEETNKVFSQQIKAAVKFRVKVFAASTGSLINQFVITAEDGRSAIDTTPFAAKVARNAMVSGLQNLLESLAAIQ
ncbi:MAG TPA: hypothetical protein VLX68_00580 [Chitinivibrionales bacterium]|nr:hypothetical protein [Chitinivibrionales bacterium]